MISFPESFGSEVPSLLAPFGFCLKSLPLPASHTYGRENHIGISCLWFLCCLMHRHRTRRHRTLLWSETSERQQDLPAAAVERRSSGPGSCFNIGATVDV